MFRMVVSSDLDPVYFWNNTKVLTNKLVKMNAYKIKHKKLQIFAKN